MLGVLVSLLRILTKAVYPQDPDGLRKCRKAQALLKESQENGSLTRLEENALADRDEDQVSWLRIVLKSHMHCDSHGLTQAIRQDCPGDAAFYSGEEITEKITCDSRRQEVYKDGLLSIFPGYITEDVHSELLGDWYPVLVIAGFNVFDLVGKSLTAVFTVRCFSGQRFL
ncbi:hypothetical protein YC2023_079950 [Brassica napus]